MIHSMKRDAKKITKTTYSQVQKEITPKGHERNILAKTNSMNEAFQMHIGLILSVTN